MPLTFVLATRNAHKVQEIRAILGDSFGFKTLNDFPGLPDSILDVIPVDFVVNAALAAAGRPAKPNDAQYFQVVSGKTNPLPFHRMYENVNRPSRRAAGSR